jgi:hypothetical protein
MRKVQILPATEQHAAEIIPHVRQADIDEFYAAALIGPEEVLRRSMAASSVCVNVDRIRCSVAGGDRPARLSAGDISSLLPSDAGRDDQPLPAAGKLCRYTQCGCQGVAALAWFQTSGCAAIRRAATPFPSLRFEGRINV